MAYEARYVFRPNAGTDFGGVMEAMKQCAALWRKHGAGNPRLWIVAAGELGNYALVVDFRNAAQYGEVADRLAADPEFRRWQAENVHSGRVSWLRSNLMRELPLT